MSAPSLLLDRKKLLPMSVAALALRIAATLALVGTVPALRAFARQYTLPERVIFCTFTPDATAAMERALAALLG